jgi:hypothetical protein
VIVLGKRESNRNIGKLAILDSLKDVIAGMTGLSVRRAEWTAVSAAVFG